MRTKQKLMASTSMLLVSAIMATSASFAWFTISTNPEVAGITTSITTNDNLEIAVNTFDATDGWGTTLPTDNTNVDSTISQTGLDMYWGNLVDLTAEFTANSTLELKPAYYDTTTTTSIADIELQFPEYGNDGRISALADLDVVASTAIDSKDSAYKENDSIQFAIYQTSYSSSSESNTTANDGDEVTETYGFETQYFLKTNQDGVISLTSATDRAGTDGDADDVLTGDAGGGSDVTGLPASLGDNLEIAFTIYEVTESGNTDPDTYAYKGTVYSALTKTGTDGEYTIGTETASGTKIVNYSASTTTLDSDATSGQLFYAEANTIYTVTMTVYLDGQTITNADATDILANTSLSINVQFANDGVDQAAMDPGTNTAAVVD